MENKNTAAERPSCVLICGNTKLLDLTMLRMVSRYYKIVVCGNISFASGMGKTLPHNVHMYPMEPTSEDFSRLMNSYTPEVVWYFSGYADNGDGLEQESRIIRRMMDNCSTLECQKIVVVSSVNSLYGASSEASGAASGARLKSCPPNAFCCAQMEALFQFEAQINQLKTVVLRLPFLSQDNNKGSWLGTLFSKMQQGDQILLPGAENQLADFISTRNLAELLISVTEETQDTAGTYTVFSGFHRKWKDVKEAVLRCRPDLTVNCDTLFANDTSVETLVPDDTRSNNVRREYGFVALDDVPADLESAYSAFLSHHEKKNKLKDRLRHFASRLPHWLLPVVEMLLLFAGMQLLLPAASNSVHFQFVDLRLFFVLIIGCSHGMLFGKLAGVIACISMYFSYTGTGITGIMQFYNINFWLPFAVYLMTGSITGYLKSAKTQKLKYMEEELFTLKNKYVFLNDVYRSVIESKKEYKRQILGYNDSFGKIFEAVQNLDSTTPSDIFLNGVETMERILDNQSVAIFTLDDYQRYGRLAACSSSLGASIPKSLQIESCKPVYDTVLQGATWKNTELIENLPAYACGITENGKVRLLIFVYEARNDQLTLYYMNLFTILCNLVRVSFVRALEYQEAVHDEKYFPGTNIMRYEYFLKEVQAQQSMAAAGVASYLLVRLDVDPKDDLGVLLKGVVRQTDTLGKNKQGECFLLLSQVDGDTFHFVSDRLDAKSIRYKLVEEIEE